MKRLEDVFKTSGVPTYTFVRPVEYPGLLVALRTPGRRVVIEGPSGIGKTTAVTRGLEELGIAANATRLSARRRDDLDVIRALPTMKSFGTVLIDDFHRLPSGLRGEIADLMKLLADEETPDCKVVLIGINRAGESLIKVAHDLNNRLELIPLETNPDEKVHELITLGEQALSVQINVKDDIISGAHGSFYIAQMLSHQACLDAGVLKDVPARRTTAVSLEAIRGKVYERLSRTFLERTKRFARGTRFRPVQGALQARRCHSHLVHDSPARYFRRKLKGRGRCV